MRKSRRSIARRRLVSSVSRSTEGASIASLEQALARATRELEVAAGAERGALPELDEAAIAEEPLPPGESLIEYYSVGDDLLAFVRRGSEIELRPVASLDAVRALVDKLDFQIGKCSLGTE